MLQFRALAVRRQRNPAAGRCQRLKHLSHAGERLHASEVFRFVKFALGFQHFLALAAVQIRRNELQAWVRAHLHLRPDVEAALLTAIDAVFTRHERLWQESKQEAIQALSAGFAEKMVDELGQQIIVDNRPGAGTMIGASAVARSPADGYMLLMGDTGTYALNPTLYGTALTYDPAKDFTPVCRTGRVPLILTANPNTVGVGSVKELIELAKKEPGKIAFGAPGPGSPIHLAMELFRQRVGIQITAIPYKGGTRSTTCLAAASASCFWTPRPA